MRVVRFHEYGGPEVLRVEHADEPHPAAGELAVAVELVGVALPTLRMLCGGGVPLPCAPGGDLVGTVTAVGPDVRGFRVGDLVAGVTFSGAYAERAVVPAALATPVPDGVSAAEALIAVRSGQVALGALRAGQIGVGDRVLVTAAAGGAGHLAVQLARALGASRVVGVVGSPDKAAFVRELGADLVVGYDELAAGLAEPVDLVVDGVGGDVLGHGLAALAPLGRLVSFSAAGGQVDVRQLMAGMTSVTAFSMGQLARRPELLEERRQELWGFLLDGLLTPVVHAELPLAEVARAHRIVAGRANLGKVVVRATA